MSDISVKGLAQKIGVEPDKLLEQLAETGIAGKKADDVLGDEEKIKNIKKAKTKEELLEIFLR